MRCLLTEDIATRMYAASASTFRFFFFLTGCRDRRQCNHVRVSQRGGANDQTYYYHRKRCTPNTHTNRIDALCNNEAMVHKSWAMMHNPHHSSGWTALSTCDPGSYNKIYQINQPIIKIYQINPNNPLIIH